MDHVRHYPVAATMGTVFALFAYMHNTRKNATYLSSDIFDIIVDFTFTTFNGAVFGAIVDTQKGVVMRSIPFLTFLMFMNNAQKPTVLCPNHDADPYDRTCEIYADINLSTTCAGIISYILSVVLQERK